MLHHHLWNNKNIRIAISERRIPLVLSSILYTTSSSYPVVRQSLYEIHLITKANANYKWITPWTQPTKVMPTLPAKPCMRIQPTWRQYPEAGNVAQMASHALRKLGPQATPMPVHNIQLVFQDHCTMQRQFSHISSPTSGDFSCD